LLIESNVTNVIRKVIDKVKMKENICVIRLQIKRLGIRVYCLWSQQGHNEIRNDDIRVFISNTTASTSVGEKDSI
jgi:hypothetical protein